MDKSAIEQIQQAQTAEAVQTALDKVNLQTPVVVTPEKFDIQNLERYLAGRVRYRGNMSTISPEDFVRYCTDHDRTGAACFVDPEAMNAVTVFNLGTEEQPGHADYTAKLQLQKTAEYRAVLGIDGGKMSQKTLAEFLEDWGDHIQAYNAEGDAIALTKAISAVRRLTIESSRKEDHEVQDFKASRSALENVEARSDHGMPSGFRFTCIPYNGLAERSFELRLSVLTGGDAPALVARIKRLEAVQEEMGQEFMELLNDSFEDYELITYLGKFSA